MVLLSVYLNRSGVLLTSETLRVILISNSRSLFAFTREKALQSISIANGEDESSPKVLAQLATQNGFRLF